MKNSFSTTRLLIILALVFVFIGTKNQLSVIQKFKDTAKTIEGVISEDNGGGETPTSTIPTKEDFNESKYSNYSQKTIEYFKEVSMGREFDNDKNYIKRWNTNVKIFVQGESTDELNLELDKIVSELNDLIDPINLEFVSDPNDANMFVFFGSYLDFHNLNPDISLTNLENNWGLFSSNTNKARLYVDIYRANSLEQKHLLREELTQSLGLFNDTDDYPNSIFYSGWTTTTEYADIDKELIDMLYNN